VTLQKKRASGSYPRPWSKGGGSGTLSPPVTTDKLARKVILNDPRVASRDVIASCVRIFPTTWKNRRSPAGNREVLREPVPLRPWMRIGRCNNGRYRAIGFRETNLATFCPVPRPTHCCQNRFGSPHTGKVDPFNPVITRVEFWSQERFWLSANWINGWSARGRCDHWCSARGCPTSFARPKQTKKSLRN